MYLWDKTELLGPYSAPANTICPNSPCLSSNQSLSHSLGLICLYSLTHVSCFLSTSCFLLLFVVGLILSFSVAPVVKEVRGEYSQNSPSHVLCWPSEPLSSNSEGYETGLRADRGVSVTFRGSGPIACSSFRSLFCQIINLHLKASCKGVFPVLSVVKKC